MNDQTTDDFDSFDGITWEMVCAGWVRNQSIR